MNISCRFCTCCLKKFFPKKDVANDENVRLFLPTLDSLMRPHFMYVEFENDVLNDLLKQEKPVSVDIAEAARILHVQKGDYPTEEDQNVIAEIYHYASAEHDFTRLAS